MNQETETTSAAAGRAALFDGLFCPLESPDEVLANPRMSVDDKRAVLASWASDACAVENQPTLRRLDSGRIIRLEDILRCLNALDHGSGRDKGKPRRNLPWRTAFDRRGTFLRAWRRGGRVTRDDHDDDPPPCPAVAAPRPPRGGQSGAFAVGDREPVFA
jgi:hypothetical protein